MRAKIADRRFDRDCRAGSMGCRSVASRRSRRASFTGNTGFRGAGRRSLDAARGLLGVASRDGIGLGTWLAVHSALLAMDGDRQEAACSPVVRWNRAPEIFSRAFPHGTHDGEPRRVDQWGGCAS